MSLLLAGLVAVGTSGALMVGRFLARRRAETSSPNDTEKKPDDEKEDADEAAGRKEVEAEVPAAKDSEPDVEAAVSPKKRTAKRERGSVKNAGKAPLDGFVCQFGDVIMRITGEEAWLAGGLVLSEEVPVAVLFVAPDAGHDLAIYVRARPNEGIYWLEPLDPTAILVGGQPPSSVEHNGIRFDRARRLPLRPRRVGVGAPDAGDAVVVAEYTSSASERLLLMKANSGHVYAYRGHELDPSTFEVIASGNTTLE